MRTDEELKFEFGGPLDFEGLESALSTAKFDPE
jgi:hypothetical protein